VQRTHAGSCLPLCWAGGAGCCTSPEGTSLLAEGPLGMWYTQQHTPYTKPARSIHHCASMCGHQRGDPRSIRGGRQAPRPQPPTTHVHRQAGHTHETQQIPCKRPARDALQEPHLLVPRQTAACWWWMHEGLSEEAVLLRPCTAPCHKGTKTCSRRANAHLLGRHPHAVCQCLPAWLSSTCPAKTAREPKQLMDSIQPWHMWQRT
jgi:hypothetical protein